MRNYMFILSFLVVFLTSCADKEFDPNDPAGSFDIAKEPYDDENYDIAAQKLGEYKARFPYSKYAAEAELLLANCHYELGNYEEAAIAYSQFAKLHPKHPKVDYALYRVGSSYWADAPEEVDREQEYTIKAIDEWKILIRRFPSSEYTTKAKTYIEQGNRRIAGSYEFIADFYCKMEIHHSCAYRALLLAQEYPQYLELRKKSLKLAAAALDILAEEKRQDPESDKNIYFKTMNADEIKNKADGIRQVLKTL